MNDNELNNDLFAALKKRRYDEALSLIDSGADLNFKNLRGETPLMAFTSLQTNDIANWIAAHGADPDLCTDAGESPLHRAITVASTDLVKTLLDAGANPNKRDRFGVTPLMLTAVMEHGAYAKDHAPDITRLLVAATGIDLDAASENGTTPAMAAAARGKSDVLKALLEAGAAWEVRDYLGLGLLHAAVMADNPDDVLQVLRDGAPMLNVNHPSLSGSTPMSMAVAAGKKSVISALLEMGADPNAKQANRFTGGITPLMSALFGLEPDFPKKEKPAASGSSPSIPASLAGLMGAFAPSDSDDLPLRLLAAGADVTVRAENGSSPLFAAISTGNTAIIPKLVAAGADPTRPADASGHLPYDILAAPELDADSPDAVRLVDDFADLGFPFERPSWDEDKDGAWTDAVMAAYKPGAPSPLTNLACMGRLDIVEAMVRRGARFDVCHSISQSTLHQIAAIDFDGLSDAVRKSIRIAKVAKNIKQEGLQEDIAARERVGADVVSRLRSLMLDSVSDWNIQDDAGRTPMHYAAQTGAADWLAFYLSAGADPSVRDQKGRTPLANALVASQSDIAGALMAYLDQTGLRAGQDGVLLDVAKSIPGDFTLVTKMMVGLRALDFTPDQVNARDSDGATPLIAAAAADSHALCSYLLESGADPTLADNSGNTALMHAAHIGSAEIVRLLMAHGCDPSAPGPAGHCAMDIARYNKDAFLLRDMASSPDIKPAPREVSAEEAASRAEYHERLRATGAGWASAAGFSETQRTARPSP